jgi:hypothetical protein
VNQTCLTMKILFGMALILAAQGQCQVTGGQTPAEDTAARDRLTVFQDN